MPFVAFQPIHEIARTAGKVTRFPSVDLGRRRGEAWFMTYGQLTVRGHRLAEAAKAPNAPTPIPERGRFLMA
jgi:hypothetical protein